MQKQQTGLASRQTPKRMDVTDVSYRFESDIADKNRVYNAKLFGTTIDRPPFDSFVIGK
jgi:hypothetical protein